jgi:hypothetical protein
VMSSGPITSVENGRVPRDSEKPTLDRTGPGSFHVLAICWVATRPLAESFPTVLRQFLGAR